MVKRHLSRLNAPKTWPIKRKGIKWVLKPRSAHPLEACMPLGLILKMLGYAKTAKEAKRILAEGKLSVDKKIRKDPKFGVGLMDIIELPQIKAQFRLLLNRRGKLTPVPISAEESMIKPCKIIGKKMLKGGKLQLNLHDGRNMIVEKDAYKVNDTLVIGTEHNEIKEHIKFEKGAIIYLTSGKQVGMVGVLESIKHFKGIVQDNITFVSNNTLFETKKDYAFVIGKDRPVIAIPTENER